MTSTSQKLMHHHLQDYRRNLLLCSGRGSLGGGTTDAWQPPTPSKHTPIKPPSTSTPVKGATPSTSNLRLSIEALNTSNTAQTLTPTLKSGGPTKRPTPDDTFEDAIQTPVPLDDGMIDQLWHCNF